jgi:hypothetical protein
MRRTICLSLASVLAIASLAQPWSGGTAEAGPGSKPAAIAPCKDDVAQLRAELAASQADNARLQAQVDKMQTAERTRAKRLADQLGAPMIERLQ